VQIKFISLVSTLGIIDFTSNLKSQEILAPIQIDIKADNNTALYIGNISLNLNFIENLKFGLNHLLRYIIRTEYATVSQDLKNTMIIKNQFWVWLWKSISKIKSLE
jgi:hypothetical protein